MADELVDDRDAAWALLTEWTQNEALLRHALAVEASVRAYAAKFGEDEEAWGNVALLHDFDYERHPTLVVEVVEQRHVAPGRLVFAELDGVATDRRLHRKRVTKQRLVLRPLRQERPGGIAVAHELVGHDGRT